DASDITQFSYDSKGNITSLTDALGHVTRITSYDGNGRPLTMIDLNGLTTTLQYDLRGRLVPQNVHTSTTVPGPPVTPLAPQSLPLFANRPPRPVVRDGDGERTRYAYDRVGQLLQHTHPDGSFKRFTYDPAHRLATVSDTLGNRLVYTRDLADN